jgi:hypothetical protein
MVLAFVVTCWPLAARGQTPEATPEALSALEAELANCPMPVGSAIPESKEYFTPWGVGEPPVWLLGFSNPPESLRDEFPVTNGGLQYMGPAFIDTENGWGMKALWVLQGGWTAPVTIHGERIGDGTPLTFDVNYGAPPVETLQLDPAEPGIPVQHGDWREWPGTLYAQESGCYELSADWNGGSWNVTIPFLLPLDAEKLGVSLPPRAAPAS